VIRVLRWALAALAVLAAAPVVLVLLAAEVLAVTLGLVAVIGVLR
jgi:hypothetical protein